MTCLRYIHILIVFFLWAYFTHLFPANLNRLACNCWNSSPTTTGWTLQNSSASSAHSSLFAFHRLRKRRDSGLGDHLHRHLSTKILLVRSFLLNPENDIPFVRRGDSTPPDFPSDPPSPPPKAELS